MYYGWTINIKKEDKGDNKYFPLIKKETIGTIVKNGASLPLYETNGQFMAIRNFGKSKISESKLSFLLEKNKEIIVMGGPCLFSRFDLGVMHNGIFYSLVTPEDRKKVPWQESGLKLQIGNSITEYHKRHIAFMQKTICRIKNITAKEPLIKVIIPCIEYTIYLPHFLPDGMKKEYWKKIKIAGEKIENLYKEKLTPLGKITIIRKETWDVPKQCDTPRDLKSYTASYFSNCDNENNLVVAIDDIVETPLLIEVGRKMRFLIGILGILSSVSDIEKEEECHPYLT